MFRGEEIGSLNHFDAEEAFEEPLAGSDVSIAKGSDLTKRVVSEVEGYPYSIQLWGAELWEAAELAGVSQLSRTLLDAAKPEIYRRLDLDF